MATEMDTFLFFIISLQHSYFYIYNSSHAVKTIEILESKGMRKHDQRGLAEMVLQW